MKPLTWIRSWLPRPRSLGQRGERAAAWYLWWRGYTIVARGYRGRRGELDIIAVRNKKIVFVEVKTRRDHQAGHPADAVDHQKQHKLVQTALEFLKHHELLESPCRFDVIAVTWPANRRRPQIEHFPHAFEPPDQGGFFA